MKAERRREVEAFKESQLWAVAANQEEGRGPRGGRQKLHVTPSFLDWTYNETCNPLGCFSGEVGGNVSQKATTREESNAIS